MSTSSGKILALGQTGNKLFQLAYAFTSQTCKELHVSFPSDSTNALELSQLESLSRKLEVKIVCYQSTKRIQKLIHNTCIRFSSKSRPGQLDSVTRQVLQFLYLIFAEDKDKFPCLVIANGTGDVPTVPESRNYAVLGYVQNANLLRGVGAKEAFGRAIDEVVKGGDNRDVDFYSDHTVLLQIRLGDYLKDKKIGVCDPEYYSLALRSIEIEIGIEQIHLYSNEPELALGLVPLELKGKVKIVGTGTETPLEIINQMRSYSCYIISNSTFGWWGAYLSRHENPIVYVPDPWFRKLEEPIGLIPQNWRRVDASRD